MSMICFEDGLLGGILREFEQKIGWQLIPDMPDARGFSLLLVNNEILSARSERKDMHR